MLDTDGLVERREEGIDDGIYRLRCALSSFGRSYQVHELLVGRGSLGARLGLEREHIRSPWILRILFGRRQSRMVPWTDVITVSNGTVRIRARGNR